MYFSFLEKKEKYQKKKPYTADDVFVKQKSHLYKWDFLIINIIGDIFD